MISAKHAIEQAAYHRVMAELNTAVLATLVEDSRKISYKIMNNPFAAEVWTRVTLDLKSLGYTVIEVDGNASTKKFKITW